MILPVIGEALVKVAILFLGDVVGVAGPNGLRLVQFFVFDIGFLDLLSLLFLVLLLFVIIVILDIFNLWFLLIFLSLFLLFFFVLLGLLIFHFLFLLFGDSKFDGVANELRVLLNNLLDLLFLDVFHHVFLELEDDLGATTEFGGFWDAGDGKGAAGCGLPLVPVVVIVLRLNTHFVGDQVGRVETDTKLTDLGNGSQVVDEISFGHSDTGVQDGQGLGLLVGDD